LFTLYIGLRGADPEMKGASMSDLQAKMAAKTAGNVASTAMLRQLFDVPDRSGGSAWQTGPEPGLEKQPGLN
jgi:hypothetical protein